MASLAQRIKEHARSLGFDLVGIAPALPADGFERLQDWLARGFAGDMGYMKRHAQARRDPRAILDRVRSVVMVALNYHSRPHKPSGNGTARVARYALGEDYHDVLRRKLKALLSFIEEQAPQTQGRAVVDTAPLLERDFARRAGLGWFGKNTMLIHPKLGSYFFLAALLLDLELEADVPFAPNHCGTCTACLDACPTQAFDGPGWLDSRRCISYLTIELRGAIDPDLRPSMDDWLFGCDVCQEVCPWNRKAPLGADPALQPRAELMALDAEELLGLTEEEFRRRFRGTALLRPGRSGLLRNAAIVLGNQGGAPVLGALEQACQDADSTVREAALWARAQINRRCSANAMSSPNMNSNGTELS